MLPNFVSPEHKCISKHAGGILEESVRGACSSAVEDEVQEDNLRSGKVSITQYMEEMENKVTL